MFCRFSPHGEHAPDFTAGWDYDAIQRQERSSSEQLSGEWAQVNAQVTPLNTVWGKILKYVLTLKHMSDVDGIENPLSTHNVSSEVG